MFKNKLILAILLILPSSSDKIWNVVHKCYSKAILEEVKRSESKIGSYNRKNDRYFIVLISRLFYTVRSRDIKINFLN